MINYRILILSALAVAALTAWGLVRLDITADVMRALPKDEKVISDSIAIFAQHPIHDQIAIDIQLDPPDADKLIELGAAVEKRMQASGLFAQVGIAETGSLLPELAMHAARSLPLLFSEDELAKQVAPLLAPERIRQRLGKLQQDLSGLEGLGQAGFMGQDPLGLKDLVLARMAPLAPSLNSTFYRGSLLSADSRHLLVTARPRGSGTDTVFARRLAALMDVDEISQEMRGDAGSVPVLTPVGAYRSALDNEDIIRHDVQLALGLSTVGIALLLYCAFPRPLLGLLSLTPSLAGTGLALFAYSLFHSSISVMVLGFGGAVISITMDCGITYLLFLDRPHETKGKEASDEVSAISLMAAITSVVAFLILSWSRFPLFIELGQFTALGVLFSYLFVHWVFPRVFPAMPPGVDRSLPLHRLVDRLYTTGTAGAAAAAVLCLCLLCFARPQFQVSLSSMNTVSRDTEAADALFAKVWGSAGERIVMMQAAESAAALQHGNDQLLAKLEEDIRQDSLKSAFVPSMLFPGPERAGQNLAAWHRFWDSGRRAGLARIFSSAGAEAGFAPEAFAGFLALLEPGFSQAAMPVPPKFHSLLGIAGNKHGPGLIQFLSAVPGSRHNGAEFAQRYGSETRIFDPAFFATRLAEMLFSGFISMLAAVAVSGVLLVFFFYLDLRQTLLTLLPPAFAYICTLGTLKLIGHPLDIPALMLSIVILGMGIDYSIFCVRAHQRYQDINHPSYVLVRSSVFMSGASVLIGFGVLCFAQHAVLRSVGITSFLGIGYSLAGAFLLLPPLLDWRMKPARPAGADITHRVRLRYQTLEAYPRMFARFKLRYDPLFADLERLLAHRQAEIRTIIDIGCGWCVPGCWCLEQFAGAEVYGLDPDPERVRAAEQAICGQGRIVRGSAPAMPSAPHPADLLLLLDMLHYLDDATAEALLRNSLQALNSNGLLVLRCTILPAGRRSWLWHVEELRIRAAGWQAWHRSRAQLEDLLAAAGFTIVISEVSAVNQELAWLIGRPANG